MEDEDRKKYNKAVEVWKDLKRQADVVRGKMQPGPDDPWYALKDSDYQLFEEEAKAFEILRSWKHE